MFLIHTNASLQRIRYTILCCAAEVTNTSEGYFVCCSRHAFPHQILTNFVQNDCFIAGSSRERRGLRGYTCFWTEHLSQSSSLVRIEKQFLKAKLTSWFWGSSAFMLLEVSGQRTVNVHGHWQCFLCVCGVINEGVNLLLTLPPVLVDRIWKIKCFLYQKNAPSITYQKCNPHSYQRLTHLWSNYALTTFSASSDTRMKRPEAHW